MPLKKLEVETDAGPIWIELETTDTTGRYRGGSDRDTTSEKPVRRFEEMISKVKPIANAFSSQIAALDLKPKEVEIRFGIKFSADVGVIIATSSAEGHCEITIRW